MTTVSFLEAEFLLQMPRVQVEGLAKTKILKVVMNGHRRAITVASINKFIARRDAGLPNEWVFDLETGEFIDQNADEEAA